MKKSERSKGNFWLEKKDAETYSFSESGSVDPLGIKLPQQQHVVGVEARETEVVFRLRRRGTSQG